MQDAGGSPGKSKEAERQRESEESRALSGESRAMEASGESGET